MRASTAAGSNVLSIMGQVRQVGAQMRKQDGYKPDRCGEVNRRKRNSAPQAGSALDFGLNETLDQGREVVVEPRLQHGTQHLPGKILESLGAALRKGRIEPRERVADGGLARTGQERLLCGSDPCGLGLRRDGRDR